jgi:hypothetical protein
MRYAALTYIHKKSQHIKDITTNCKGNVRWGFSEYRAYMPRKCSMEIRWIIQKARDI